MKQKTVLITGANGQLGQALFKASEDLADLKIIFTDVEQLDITNSKQVRSVIESLRPFAVVNCAAYTAVDKAESEPEAAALLNTGGPANLAVACALTGSLLIHISTDYVFGGNGTIPYKEDHPADPQGVYARSKAGGEQAVITSGSDYIIIRTSWLYSVYGHNFVKTMLRLGQEREELKVVNDQIGSPTNAEDLAKTILQIIQHPMADQHIHEIFHFANTGAISWFEFATEIMNYAKLNCKVLPISTSEYPLPAPRPAYSVLDTTKIRSTFSIEVPGWKESLHRCLDELLG
jgi:dTDP-4-dehydrorhamnose reductase